MTATPSIAAIEPFASDRARVIETCPEKRELVAELERLEPVVSAAVLAATAFRMRDHEGLISALRMLVRATRVFEDRHAC